MDITSFIGIVIAIALIVGSIMVGTAPISTFVDLSSLFLVGGGAIAAVLICFPLSSILGCPKVMLNILRHKPADKVRLIKQLVALADVARREGLAALERRISEIENPLVRTGVQLTVDGSSPETVEQVLRAEADAIGVRHHESKAIVDQLGRFAPAYGMIGALLGLIMIPADFSDPAKLGHGVVTALVATLYGLILANVFFCPFAEKLGLLSRSELTCIEIIIRGVTAIQSGESPRTIEQKLRTFIPPHERYAA